MKIQVFILLGLMCYSAFSACATLADASYLATGATLGGKTYYIGTDATDKLCCVREGTTGAGTTLGAVGAGTCVAKAILVANSKLWVVVDEQAGALPLATTGLVAITPVGTLANLIAIGQVEVGALGTTVSGSYIGSITGTTWAAITWGTAAPVVCTTSGNTNLISISATPVSTNVFVDQTTAANTIMTAPKFYGYDTVTKNFKGYESDPCTATFTKVQSVTTNSIEYQVGTKGNECCVKTGTTEYCYNDVNLPGTCTALDIAADSTNNEVWIAARVTKDANVLTTENGAASVDYAKSQIAPASLTIDTVFVAKITTAATNFGKIIFGAYVAPKTTGGTFTTFTFTDLRACTANSLQHVQVEGTLGTSTWVDETGTAIAAATGTGAFLVITPSNGNIDGFASSGRVCAGASILSIASALLAFVGLVAL